MISVVIPTLDAVPALTRSLPPLIEASARGLVREVIITDGGSADAIKELADACGARFIEGPRGRGGQLARGAEGAKGPWLLFLHADCSLKEGWAGAVSQFMARPDTAQKAAYFTLRFDASGLAPELVAWGANIRSRIFALPYGDQGLLIRKDFYGTLGGYAPLPLFEDVDLTRRLRKKKGKKSLCRLNASVETSAVRYKEDGYLKHVLRNFHCLCLYLAGHPPGDIARRYGMMPPAGPKQ